jgi:signal transduction histidine kinase
MALAVGALGLAALAVLAGSWLATSQTRPLEQLRVSALRMAQGDFSQRLPEDRHDEIGELAAAFNHMAGQVERMMEEQRAFATNAAHELRTPLTTIRLRSEVLREGTMDKPTSLRYIAEIDDEATHLSNLVNDLFLLSRFDAGRAELGREQIEPQRLARSLVNELSPRAVRQNVRLVLEESEGLPVITTNQNHLRVVFYNLLDNALKYTPAGGLVDWRMQMEDGRLRVTIRDTGLGIAPEELPRLFERFYRTDKAHERTVSGTGLGLSLVRSIVTAYGGRITIDSGGLGQGSVAEVWWPVTPVALPEVA